ncbi:MAG TPA: hypothetical protein VFN35_26755, partial [Ktedonobacteraceae bacterium]|nr:hypothetical protein [Ktedonobacteraceae bacterium]
NLALTDCILLVCIFLLTLVATWQANLTSVEIEKQAEQLRISLSHALGDAALCLSKVRRQQQQNQPNNLSDVAKYLYQFSEQFKQTTQQFLNELGEERKRRGDMTAFTNALDRMSKDMLAAATSIHQTNADLTTTLKDILVPVKEIPGIVVASNKAVGELNRVSLNLGQLVADQNKWRQELQSALANGLNQLTADQRQANQNMQNLLSQQTSEQKQAAQDLQSMLGTLFNQLLAEQKQTAHDLQNTLGTSFAQLLAEQMNLGQALITTATDLEDNTQALGNFVQGLGKTATEQTQVLALMQTVVGEQKRLTAEMAGATLEIKNVLRSVRESVPELRSMALDIDKFVNALRAIPAALNNDLLAPLQHYSSASAKLNDGSDVLSRAALYLESATKKLDGRLGP